MRTNGKEAIANGRDFFEKMRNDVDLLPSDA